jgi:hypothetical protein
MSEQDDHGKSQARAQLPGIVTIMSRMKHIEDCENGDGSEPCELTDQQLVEGCDEYWGKDHAPLPAEEKEEYSVQYHDKDAASESIDEYPLSVEVRGGWHTPGEKDEMKEYTILLCIGGPACRIIGDLSDGNVPSSARLEYQDWGTPWTEYFDFKDDERELLLAYAQHFYYGE